MSATDANRRCLVRRLRSVSLLTLALVAAAPAAASASDLVSSNWAGYVAVQRSGHSKPFASVSGTWVVPKLSCTTGEQAESAVWVGLGGYNEGSKGLEQLGTEQDCSRTGAASYGTWFELLPAAPVEIHLQVRPGDTVTASATVAGRDATFRIRDLTTGARYSTTRHVSSKDVSSAEWIVEAPSVCSTSGNCSTLRLARIGSVAFSGATATAATRTEAAGDSLWSNAALELKQASLSVPADGTERAAPEQTVLSATPSAITQPSGAFSVSLAEQTTQLSVPSGPTLPGFGQGG